jgi:hypothetical protein
MNAGDTFLIPDGISVHLNFVLAVLADGSLIICHFTTRRARSDTTCVVQAGEHQFIDRETVIRYDQAYVCEADRIVNLKGVITKQLDALSKGLLARIRQGALDSPQTPDPIKEHLRNG